MAKVKIRNPAVLKFSLNPIYNVDAYCIYFDPRKFIENTEETICLILLDCFSEDEIDLNDIINLEKYLSGPTFFMGEFSSSRIQFEVVKKLEVDELFLPKSFAQRGYYDWIFNLNQIKLEEMKWYIQWVGENNSDAPFNGSYKNILHLPYDGAHGLNFVKNWSIFHYEKITGKNFYNQSLKIEKSRNPEDYEKMCRGEIEYDDLFITASLYQFEYPTYKELRTLKGLDFKEFFKPLED